MHVTWFQKSVQYVMYDVRICRYELIFNRIRFDESRSSFIPFVFFLLYKIIPFNFAQFVKATSPHTRTAYSRTRDSQLFWYDMSLNYFLLIHYLYTYVAPRVFSVHSLITISLLKFAHLEFKVVIKPFATEATRNFFVFYLCRRCIFHISRFHALVGNVLKLK